MTTELPSVNASALLPLIGSAAAPQLIDVRRDADFVAAGRIIAGSLRRSPDLTPRACPVGAQQQVVVYCAHGRAVSQGACRTLRDAGIDAAYLEGGYTAWTEVGGPTIRWRSPLAALPSRWVTRERPKIDRIACPWLIRRFIDPLAEFFYVPVSMVMENARRLDAVPYDVPGAEFSHAGPQCSFDAFIQHFELEESALAQLATIVRGADTARLDLAPQAAGLLAISLGLSANFSDDHTMLEHGMTLYDALYTWSRHAQHEGHDWKPATMPLPT